MICFSDANGDIKHIVPGRPHQSDPFKQISDGYDLGHSASS